MMTLYLMTTLYLMITHCTWCPWPVTLENSVIRFEKLLLVAFILLNLAFSGTISMFIFYFDSKED